MSGAHLPFPESAEDREAAVRLHSRTRVTVWPEADPFDRPEWHQRAACRGVGVDVFFSKSNDSTAYDEARTYCRRCPVIDECAAVGRREKFGLFAGLTVKQRGRRNSKAAS